MKLGLTITEAAHNLTQKVLLLRKLEIKDKHHG